MDDIWGNGTAVGPTMSVLLLYLFINSLKFPELVTALFPLVSYI